MSAWPFDPKLKDFGAVYAPALVAPGQTLWRIVIAQGPFEWGGRHSIFVDVRDEQDRRVVGTPVTMWWADGMDTKSTEPKTGENFAVDFPIFAQRNSYGVRMGDGLPTDSLFGMGLLPFQGHVAFRVVFRRMAGTEGPTAPPAQPLSARQALDEAARYIDLARRLL